MRAAAAIAIVAFLAGCGGGGSSPSTKTAAPKAPVALSPSVPAAPPAAKATPVSQTASGLGMAGFWHLIEETRAQAGNDTGRQTELLAGRLKALPAQQVAEFSAIRHRLDQQAYTWDLWGAAYVIEDGCSDDCFRDFRGYLISLGQKPYESALKNPDSLAPVVQDAEKGSWENADNPAPDVYKNATGQDIPGGDSDLSGTPRGTQWDDNQIQLLVRRYPALAARFR
ncbi:MAG: hypothetical protein QOF12_1050 [Solirubrobacteraceae bacterium]|jgi:hypothetical protein|nr:hypothetical protein [Solirubrobacteraceae bacterium]